MLKDEKLYGNTGGMLPADEGHESFRNRIDKNPYSESEWQHDEWQFGWDCEEQSEPDAYDHVLNKFIKEN